MMELSLPTPPTVNIWDDATDQGYLRITDITHVFHTATETVLPWVIDRHDPALKCLPGWVMDALCMDFLSLADAHLGNEALANFTLDAATASNIVDHLVSLGCTFQGTDPDKVQECMALAAATDPDAMAFKLDAGSFQATEGALPYRGLPANARWVANITYRDCLDADGKLSIATPILLLMRERFTEAARNTLDPFLNNMRKVFQSAKDYNDDQLIPVSHAGASVVGFLAATSWEPHMRSFSLSDYANYSDLSYRNLYTDAATAGIVIKAKAREIISPHPPLRTVFAGATPIQIYTSCASLMQSLQAGLSAASPPSYRALSDAIADHIGVLQTYCKPREAITIWASASPS